MRFIPSPDHAQHTQILSKYGDIIRRQAWYTADITRASTFDLIDIDNKHDNLPMSLRKMIMEMKNSAQEPLFLTVDKFWDNSVSLVFPKKI